MKRKLASIQKIDNIESIKGANNIVKATVLGWECVVKKDEFNIGDYCVYFEIDSILPPTPDFDFMENRKFRVRTIKLRKQIAQGLALPIELLNNYNFNDKIEEGVDVTDVIGVKKYEPAVQKDTKQRLKKPKNPVVRFFMRWNWFVKLYMKIYPHTKLPFPDFISKTHEKRIQNIPSVFRKNIGKSFYITEKLDGQSATFAKYKGKFYVCSHNFHLQKRNESNWWKIAKKLDLENLLPEDIAIQGEITGPSIRGNKYNQEELSFSIFNIVNLRQDGGKFSLQSMNDFCLETNLTMVPILNTNLVLDETMTVKDMIALSEGKSKLLASQDREGIVVSRHDRKVSFKSISPKFLLKNED